MTIAVYNYKWMAPAKCGTRYLDSLYGIPHNTNEVDSSKKIVVDSNKLFLLSKINSITHLIIREPLTMFEAALHTDILRNNNGKFTSVGIQLEDVEMVLNRYLNTGTAHWSKSLWFDLYEFLKSKQNIEIVKLDTLTKFVWEQTGIRKYGFKSNYNFQPFAKANNGYSRETILNAVKEKFPTHWEKISELYEIDKVWYDKIMNGDYMREEVSKVEDTKKTFLL